MAAREGSARWNEVLAHGRGRFSEVGGTFDAEALSMEFGNDESAGCEPVSDDAPREPTAQERANAPTVNGHPEGQSGDAVGEQTTAEPGDKTVDSLSGDAPVNTQTVAEANPEGTSAEESPYQPGSQTAAIDPSSTDDLDLTPSGTVSTGSPDTGMSSTDEGTATPRGPPRYRGMLPGEDGPEIGPSGKTLGARVGSTDQDDVAADDDGMVHPRAGRISVNDSPTGMPRHRRPPSFGGIGKKLSMYGIIEDDLPVGLAYMPDPANPGHGFIEPIYSRTVDAYQGLLASTVSLWDEVFP